MIAGRQFLTVSDVLAEHSGEEFHRSRLGRLYYAAWLEARAYCEEHLGYSRTRMAREHQAIASTIGNIDFAVSHELRSLRSARNAADYDTHLSGEEIANLLDLALESSTWVIARIDELRRDANA